MLSFSDDMHERIVFFEYEQFEMIVIAFEVLNTNDPIAIARSSIVTCLTFAAQARSVILAMVAAASNAIAVAVLGPRLRAAPRSPLRPRTPQPFDNRYVGSHTRTWSLRIFWRLIHVTMRLNPTIELLMELLSRDVIFIWI